ncbi:SNF2 helicase, putative [Bodo saltans]|uniref:SNF2 helicase, putative n=1 Tax=Bodo saltans TaxID=75058 RepID=A0A0S4IVS4_BODSA|nr:SNF2 helicase, putative [Bodo saltans]|eukprot:CUG05363.1 SNF2 helicase, putative [Bodo saltans]
MPQILCEELMCLQIASQRLLHHRNNGSRTSTGHQREMDSEFSPAFFTIQQSDGKGNHVKTAATGDSATLNDAAPSRPAAEIHVAWNRVCKEVILASRFETVAERNDNLPLSVLDALPMSTKLVATKIARRLGIFTNTATAARFGGNVAAPTRRPKHAMYANLIEEFRTAWQHHQEAQSRARLKALKENDADAYMECLQHTKLTSLLHIMELTHSFMISIGAQLDKQQTAQQRPQVSSAHGQERPGHQTKNTTATTIAGDDYSRFKEYVASTKDEYKLVHKSAVYVEQQPVGLNATLMPHQLVGLRFLASLHANNINGILADEMGVGKTIQTIAFLLCLKEGGSGAPPFYGPHLVIAPLSIVREWSEACEQFVKGTMNCGELGEIIASGERLDTFDLVFLAAHRVRNVTAAINAVRWGYIVVDEAHKAVSNLKTMTAQAINAIPCKHRLVLTGTPLNSDLQELWSLLNFINPNIFKDLNSFDDVFRKPFQAIGAGDGHEGAQLNDEERALLVMRLHQVIRPFMLRRTKRDIDQTLQISYHEIHCPLTFPQEMLLRTLREEKQLPCVIEGRCVHRSVLTIEQSAQSLCNHAFMIPFLSQVLEKNRLHALALLPPPPQTSPPTVVDVGSKQKCDEKVSVANASSAQHLYFQRFEFL